MGSYGVGRFGWRPHIEDAKAFDLMTFRQYHGNLANLAAMGSWAWTRNGQRTASVAYHLRTDDDAGELVLSYKLDGESKETRIQLITLPMNFGGRRWWMICPASGKRARKLYLFPGLDQFVHREAIRPKPTYAIQRTSGTDKIIQQRWAIRQKIGDDFSTLFDSLHKPKGMRQSTFIKHWLKDMRLAEQEYAMLSQMMGMEDIKAVKRS